MTGIQVEAKEMRPRSAEFLHDFNQADDVVVEGLEMSARNPIFENGFAADLMDLVGIEEVFAHIEARDVSDTGCFDVPIAGDAGRVVLIQDGVENRLIGQSRWPSRKAASSN